MKYLTTPLRSEDLTDLCAGDKILLSGVIYTARDAAHARLVKLLKDGQRLPFNLSGQVIYYVGPTPKRPGKVIGSAGPTTSYRMDPYTPILLENGLKGMIGKGIRSPKVKESISKYLAVYFGAVGGVAALLAAKIQRVELIAYPELGAEAIRKLVVKDFPLIVINDIYGGDLYETGRLSYQRMNNLGRY